MRLENNVRILMLIALVSNLLAIPITFTDIHIFTILPFLVFSTTISVSHIAICMRLLPALAYIYIMCQCKYQLELTLTLPVNLQYIGTYTMILYPNIMNRPFCGVK